MASPASPINRLFAPDAPPFALLYRPGRGSFVEILVGHVEASASLDDIPLPPGTAGAPTNDVLVVVPYRQLAERGFACNDDHAPLLVLRIREQERISLHDALLAIPRDPVTLTDAHFDIADREYADIVRAVLAEEIGQGRGSNFVIKRTFLADIPHYSIRSALSIFSRLLTAEQGSYWTFLVHANGRTFVGASPELHAGLSSGTVVMNPISGTHRYPPQGPDLPELLAFLGDPKETDELNMVLDEELKTMAGMCPLGGSLTGPTLREMARLAHTEYLLSGHTAHGPRDVLRATMFAPTVVGSPLESACEVVARYEPTGRGYYAGAVAVIGSDESGEPEMDSAILIRTAEIDASGRLRVGVGATLVRHSDPDSEVAETHAKISGLLSAFCADDDSQGQQSAPRAPLAEDSAVRAILTRREDRLASFWRRNPHHRQAVDPQLVGRRVLVVDAEDGFTAMLGAQLSALGLVATIQRYTESTGPLDYDLVVLGPGPGDPLDHRNPKMAVLRELTRGGLRAGVPLLSVCLSHQVLAALLGLRIVRKAVPNQGRQADITLFGTTRTVGFYNTFAAVSDHDRLYHAGLPAPVEVCRDPVTGEVHALRGPGFTSLQFHPESVLSLDGLEILRETLRPLLAASTTVASS
ncbi:anthranilate synthase family protein [Micromonospora sp. NPDC048830]|uniref:anthranilate synthase family protein n=1 Tax=Micromonospora sp. NPDC048830 TaxID=3364257 RepID=UPI003714781D